MNLDLTRVKTSCLLAFSRRTCESKLSCQPVAEKTTKSLPYLDLLRPHGYCRSRVWGFRDRSRFSRQLTKFTLLAVGLSFAKVGRGMVGALKFLRNYHVVDFSTTSTEIPPVVAMGGSGCFHTGRCSFCPAIENSRQKFG